MDCSAPSKPHRRLYAEVGTVTSLRTKSGCTDMRIRPLAPQHQVVPLYVPRDLVDDPIAKIPTKVRQQIMDAYRDRQVRSKNLIYSSTAERSAKEGTKNFYKSEPSVSTIESNADQVRYRPRRYEQTSYDWQRVGPYWDRVQLRHSDNSDPVKARTYQEMVMDRRKRRPPTPPPPRPVLPEKLGATFVRQLPRYGGFVPREPIPQHCGRTVDTDIYSCMKATYVPKYMVGESAYNHRGPLSTQVTLTYPYNPFNLIDKGETPSYYVGLDEFTVN